MYKWVAFLPSRVDARYAVPNRYFAAQPNGELKVRGIEVRRTDTPEFIKQVQSELLAELARTSTRTELAAALPRLMEIVAQQIDRLRAGQVPLQDLVLTYRLSRAPEDYRANTLNAIVARELAGRGVILEPGECVRYVITHNKADVPSDRARSYEFLDGSCGYDVERYIELLLRAVETVTTPLGVNARMLQNWLTKELPADHLRTRFKSKKPQAYLGPLFEFVA
jgi:DNA polymerase-2